MDRKIIVTADNSKTLLIPELNETYHSTNGAIQEAKHVFIDAGLSSLNLKEIQLLEMGFGTGLNAILTLDYAIRNKIKVHYTTIEAFPVGIEMAMEMDYLKDLNLEHLKNQFEKLHNSLIEEKIQIDEYFIFTKHHLKLTECTLRTNQFNLVYYDAFGPKVQPDLWTIESLGIIQKAMTSGGVLVTYCAQGQFKRNLKALNFNVESIPGPPGKREMTRASLN